MSKDISFSSLKTCIKLYATNLVTIREVLDGTLGVTCIPVWLRLPVYELIDVLGYRPLAVSVISEIRREPVLSSISLENN